MRLRVSHRTVYTYVDPMTRAIQTLRVRPRSHEGQFVGAWRIDVDADCRLYRDEDAYGNLTDTFYIDGPSTKVTVAVEGEVETIDTTGFVRGTAERLPLEVYLRETPATTPDAAIRDLAARVAAGREGDTLGMLHALQNELYRTRRIEGMTLQQTQGNAAPAPALAPVPAPGVDASPELAEAFVSAARQLGVPARYVGGYLYKGPETTRAATGHAWAEAYVPNYGWIGFDPANDVCVTEAYIRVAAGMDRLDAAPVRGAQAGGTEEKLEVEVIVELARAHTRPLPVAG
jgi:transglutaminase-like putative cysteine protease